VAISMPRPDSSTATSLVAAPGMSSATDKEAVVSRATAKKEVGMLQ
jgi:hypothetical protein